MSYEIIYDKQFVKVTENIFIPIILQGSNNLYDNSGNGQRRYRDWNSSTFLSTISGTQNSMLEFQEKIRRGIIERKSDEYTDKSFGYYASLSDGGGGCNMTFGRFQGIVKTGCKKALTVEQLRDENVVLVIQSYSSHKDENEKFIFAPKTTEELINFIENTEPDLLAKGYRLYATFNGMFEEKPRRIRKKYFPQEKKQKQVMQAKEAFVVEFESPNQKGYLVSLRGGSFRYTFDNRTAVKFLNEKDAEKFAKKLRERRADIKFKVSLQSYLYSVEVKA